MRMWMIPPEYLCRQHLLAEHSECHYAKMMVEGERKTCGRRDLDWYKDHGFIEIQSIKSRHDALVEEMLRRGYKHHTPMEFETNIRNLPVDIDRSYDDLIDRCSECRERICAPPSNVIPMVRKVR